MNVKLINNVTISNVVQMKLDSLGFFVRVMPIVILIYLVKKLSQNVLKKGIVSKMVDLILQNVLWIRIVQMVIPVSPSMKLSLGGIVQKFLNKSVHC